MRGSLVLRINPVRLETDSGEANILCLDGEA
jgi:hypothetical protein